MGNVEERTLLLTYMILIEENSHTLLQDKVFGKIPHRDIIPSSTSFFSVYDLSTPLFLFQPFSYDNNRSDFPWWLSWLNLASVPALFSFLIGTGIVKNTIVVWSQILAFQIVHAKGRATRVVLLFPITTFWVSLAQEEKLLVFLEMGTQRNP